jgi:teichoic acid transport system permease protein
VSDTRSPLRSGKQSKAAATRDPDTGRLSAPGQLMAGDVGIISSTEVQGEPLAELARRYGLRPSAQRPTIPEYILQLWRRRHFITAFATARNIAMYTEARLGQLWQVLTPLLNVGVYWLIFGIILNTSKGIPDFISFLVVGVFVFNFTQRAFISTSTVITDSLPLIRALQFPRAALPLAYVIIELQQMILSMVVMFVIILLRPHEGISWEWVLVIPVLFLQAVFNVGVGLFVARLGSQVNDFSQLLPFLLRTWMYISGVLFSTLTLARTSFGEKHHELVALLQINPAAIYITLMRLALLKTQRESAPGSGPNNPALCKLWPAKGGVQYLYNSRYCPAIVNPSHYWYYAVGWAVVAIVVGFIFFWRAEVRYGRG